jgi:hypothetical protein
VKTALAEPPEPNGILPCGTESARRRHTIRAEECPECEVEGAVPPEVWKGRRTRGVYLLTDLPPELRDVEEG